MLAARKMFDGYDCGVLVADDYVGRILNLLADLGVDDETVVMLSGDHGENLGEMNVYGDHQTADQITTRIPMILRWPGLLEEGATAPCIITLTSLLRCSSFCNAKCQTVGTVKVLLRRCEMVSIWVANFLCCPRPLGRVNAVYGLVITSI